MQVQEQWTDSELGNEYVKAVYMVTRLFKLHAEYSMWNAGLVKHKLESRFPEEISITSDMQMTPLLWQKAKN